MKPVQRWDASLTEYLDWQLIKSEEGEYCRYADVMDAFTQRIRELKAEKSAMIAELRALRPVSTARAWQSTTGLREYAFLADDVRNILDKYEDKQ